MKNKNLFRSVFLSPFVYLRPSVRTEAYIVLFLLLLQIAMLFVTESFASLWIIFASVLASFCADFLNREQNYKKSFVIITSLIRALVIGLLLPSSFPPVAVFFLVFFVLFVNKHLLGGFANSWVNPVAVAVSVAWIIGMKFFPVVEFQASGLQSSNIALSLIRDGTFSLNSFDVVATNWLNNKIFSFFGLSIPEGYVSLFWDSRSSIPAFRFNFLTLLSSIVLFSTEVMNPIIPGVFIFVYSLLVKIFAPLFYGGLILQGDLLLALLTSGTLFCTFFMLQWHGTTPFSNRGKWLYGALAGILAFFILGIGLSPAGFAFIVLIMNVLSLFIQSVENHFLKDFTSSVLVPQANLVREGRDA